MTTKTTYTVPSIPGSKRTSPKPYTHAVIGQIDLAAARRRAADDTHSDQSNWDHYQEILKVGIGGVWHRDYTVDEQMHADAVEACRGMAHFYDYRAAMIEKRLARVNEDGTGPLGPMFVMQWSMSRGNAEKSVGKWAKYFVNVRVVECVPATPEACSDIKRVNKAKRAQALNFSDRVRTDGTMQGGGPLAP